MYSSRRRKSHRHRGGNKELCQLIPCCPWPYNTRSSYRHPSRGRFARPTALLGTDGSDWAFRQAWRSRRVCDEGRFSHRRVFSTQMQCRRRCSANPRMRHQQFRHSNSQREFPYKVGGGLFERTLASSGNVLKSLGDFGIQL